MSEQRGGAEAQRFAFNAPPDGVADWRLVVLYAAAEDAGLLAALPGTAAEVAERAGGDVRAARVVLDALALWAVVTRDDAGRYQRGPGAASAEELPALFQHARTIRQHSAFLPDRLAGVASPLPELSRIDADRWQRGMGMRARRQAPAVVDACLARLSDVRRVVDLGGGHGEYSLEFARRGLSVVLQDRPGIIELAREKGILEAAGVELFAGDFFETLPEGPFDLVFCAGVTHTFDGDHNRQLYQRVRPLLGPHGGMGIVTILPGTPQAALFAVQMLVVARGGDTHAEDDYRRWLAEAGFTAVERVDLALPQTLLFARPS